MFTLASLAACSQTSDLSMALSFSTFMIMLMMMIVRIVMILIKVTLMIRIHIALHGLDSVHDHYDDDIMIIF